MRFITKKIRLISMTEEEHSAFLNSLREAANGHTVHYAETKLSDGTFLGVNIDPEADRPMLPKMNEPKRASY